MINSMLILLTQEIPARIGRVVYNLRAGLRGKDHARIQLLENIDHFPTVTPKSRRALLTLAPEAWLIAVNEYPQIRLFNYYGLTYEIVRALNENGYVVDIADLNREHIPAKHYDLFVGHGGRCRDIIDNLGEDAVIYQYVSGAHWDTFNRESRQRYERFGKSRGVPVPERFRRDLTEALEGEEYLLQKADCLFTIDCPRMVASFGPHRSKFFFTGLGAYIDKNLLLLPPAERDHDAGRRNFIYVGGTGGNIQKGLDILLETFAATPALHLFIYCKVEVEISNHYKEELALPNIHYIYHLRHPFFSARLKRLMRKISFSIHAPINCGMGTAFMGTLGLGLIPVGYVDLNEDPECTVLCHDWGVDSIKECIERASAKDAGWCREASARITRVYDHLCGSTSLRSRFNELFSDAQRLKVQRHKCSVAAKAGSTMGATIPESE